MRRSRPPSDNGQGKVVVMLVFITVLSAGISLLAGSHSKVGLSLETRRRPTDEHPHHLGKGTGEPEGHNLAHPRRRHWVRPAAPPPPPPAPVYEHRLDNPQCRDAKIHIIFSTICESYGDWQAEGLIYSHYATGMKGTITRISSCSNPNYTYPKAWHPCYANHLAPDVSGQTSTFNKAFALKDFFEKGDGATLPKDAIVVLLDADMLLLQPLDSPDLPDAERIAAIKDGKPLAMLYQLGAGWITKEANVMDKVGFPHSINHRTALDHFQVGAPHFLTVHDWQLAAPRWAIYAQAMWDKYKPHFPWDADMFAFNMALLSLGIYHEQSSLLMVSDPNAAIESEGWLSLELGHDESAQYMQLPVPSQMPEGYVPRNKGQVPIIHYCQFYSIPVNGDEGPKEKGEHEPGYSFGKYDYKMGFSFAEIGRHLMSCPPRSTDIYMASPKLDEEMWAAWEDEGRAHYGTYHKHTPRSWHPKFGGHRKTLPGGLEDRRRVFLIRELTQWLNAAMRHYRWQICGSDGT